MNEKVEIQIGNRRLIVEIEGLTPMEISGLAQKVTDRLTELQGAHRNVADTSKIALLAALSFAAELDKEQRAHETTRRMAENTAERMTQSLRDSLEAGKAPEGA